ncbi:helix-turn-helix transcriptional regulator [Mannheimia bovis]|uniref:Helix-turn-helix transcriptional regulator n=1 Tax=Mannheimia bovis TaxID=2770636 RepID=A0A7H1C5G0_9PAST|nr:helix-turn-helix transcriptional regulator [Mannheimia bovis]
MNKIAEIRNRLGVSQAQLAVQIGWGQPRIANYETGNRTPSVYVAQKIVEGLNSLGANVRIDDVFPVGN